MTMPRFSVPEIPWELVDECKRKMRKVWDLQDLDLHDPALAIEWARPAGPTQSRASMGGLYKAPIAQMIRDPEVDVGAQLQSVREEIEYLEAGDEIGLGLVNFPSMHMIHFGTGPLATAFGSRMVVREDEQPFFEPAVHSPAEVLSLRKPNLRRDGICPLILERIDYCSVKAQVIVYAISPSGSSIGAHGGQETSTRNMKSHSQPSNDGT